MISGVWRWPVSLSGGFSRSRRCCVAVFCEASGFWKYRGQRRARSRGGEARRDRFGRAMRASRPSRGSRAAEIPPRAPRVRRADGRTRDRAAWHTARTLRSTFGSSPVVYARYLMCIGFALNGGGEFAVPAPPPTPLPPPMLAFPRESPVCTLQMRCPRLRAGAEHLPQSGRARAPGGRARPSLPSRALVNRLTVGFLAGRAHADHPSTPGAALAVARPSVSNDSPKRAQRGRES
jgi:hypothetical protein